MTARHTHAAARDGVTPSASAYGTPSAVSASICAALLGDKGQGFKLAMAALNVVRLAQVGARAVGKVCQVLGRVVDRAVQVLGGMGICKDLPIERYYRDARIYRIFDGSSEIHRTVIGRRLLKRGGALFDLRR